MKEWFVAYVEALIVAAGTVAWGFVIAVLLAGCGGGAKTMSVETKPATLEPGEMPPEGHPLWALPPDQSPLWQEIDPVTLQPVEKP
jgi:hypothetical protein